MKTNVLSRWLFLLAVVPALVFAGSSVTTPNPKLYSDGVRTDLASATSGVGASMVGYMPAGASAVQSTVQSKIGEVVSVKDFGAVGDFNPSTGAGTDSRGAIQAAFNYAQSVAGGCKVVFPPGRYYGGAAAGTYAGSTQLVIGDVSANSAVNVDVEGYGAELYQGARGRFVGIFGANRVRWAGLKMFGYTGGALGSNRQNDALITVNYNSQNVLIEDNYLTNSLGDDIYVGGSLVSGGGLGHEARNITIRGNTLKQRYGNGVASSSGGSMSRTNIALIDAVGVNIFNNILYGVIDLEPNLNRQHLVNIHTYHNDFRSGNVTAQPMIGTAYWYDEPINLSGGSVITQGVSNNGIPGLPIVSGCTVEENTFEYGTIFHYNVYKFDRIVGNTFQVGQILSGSTSGANNTAFTYIENNKAFGVLPGETTFIKLNGLHTYANFINNSIRQAGVYCLNNNGASTGDNGRNVFVNNKNMDAGRLGDMGFSPLYTSYATEDLVAFSTLPTVAGTTTAGTQTYSVQKAYYSRVGRIITVTLDLAMKAKDETTAGSIVIKNGAPLLAVNISGLSHYFPIVSSNVTIPASSTLFGDLEPSTKDILIYAQSSGGFAPVWVAALANNSNISFTFTYESAQ